MTTTPTNNPPQFSCPACGYALLALAGRCSECGAELTADMAAQPLLHAAAQHRSQLLRGVTLLLIALGVGAFLPLGLLFGAMAISGLPEALQNAVGIAAATLTGVALFGLPLVSVFLLTTANPASRAEPRFSSRRMARVCFVGAWALAGSAGLIGTALPAIGVDRAVDLFLPATLLLLGGFAIALGRHYGGLARDFGQPRDLPTARALGALAGGCCGLIGVAAAWPVAYACTACALGPIAALAGLVLLLFPLKLSALSDQALGALQVPLDKA